MVPAAAETPEPDAIADDEWDELTAALNQWGIIHVAPGRPHPHGASMSARDLIARLAQSTDPRLRQAIVPLLLTHPQLAGDARAAIEELSGTARDLAMRRYVAAAAMQRMARTRIEMRLGAQPAIPPAYLAELDLPSLDEAFGRETLLALAERERKRYGYDAWGTYRTLLDLFPAEMRRKGWGACANAPTANA
jgi:hypothetical protein